MGKKKVTDEHRMVAVQAQDLKVLSLYRCEDIGGICQPRDIEAGNCCNSCWVSHFAQKALGGESVKAAERDQPKNIDLWDLLHGLQDTVEALGGAFQVDLERAVIWLRPPKFEQSMELKLHIVPRVPREDGRRRCPKCGGTDCRESVYSPRDILALYCGECEHEWEVPLR